MKLSQFNKQTFNRGRPWFIEGVWVAVHGFLFASWLPGSAWRCFLLKLFGAVVGRNVNIKPKVRIKFPWRLTIGDDCWIGENVWIDNLAEVKIGNNVCISQGAYLCTGNHDYRDPAFALKTAPIVIEGEVWICAFAKIAPGLTVRKKSVVGFGSILTQDTEESGIYAGNPAKLVRYRKEKE